MIKIIKGKGKSEYYCPKCKVRFECAGEECAEIIKCPICEMLDKGNKEDTFETKAKKLREKLKAAEPKDSEIPYMLVAFDWLVENAEDRDSFEDKMTEALKSASGFSAFALSLALFAPFVVFDNKKEK